MTTKVPTPTLAPAPATPTPTPPAPPVPPTPPVRRRPIRRFSAALFWAAVGALATLFAANLAGFGPALVQHESVRVVLPPQRAAQPVQLPEAPKPRVAAPAPQPAPAVTPSAPQPEVTPAAPKTETTTINIYPPALPAPQVETPISPPASVRAVPSAQMSAPLCPKAGYYILSHEPTTDSRQFDDRRNWNPGHMEFVRECRNGTLHEFSRWVGHHLPG